MPSFKFSTASPTCSPSVSGSPLALRTRPYASKMRPTRILIIRMPPCQTPHAASGCFWLAKGFQRSVWPYTPQWRLRAKQPFTFQRSTSIITWLPVNKYKSIDPIPSVSIFVPRCSSNPCMKWTRSKTGPEWGKKTAPTEPAIPYHMSTVKTCPKNIPNFKNLQNIQLTQKVWCRRVDSWKYC